MNVRKSFKISIAALSTIMFIYQTSVTVIKLTDPPDVDSTTTLDIADIDILVTICPLDQWNVSKLNELGYIFSYSLLLGNDSNGNFVGWGAHLNLTFEDLVLEVQNYNLKNPQIDLFNPQYGTSTEIAYEKNFYFQFGWCYDLVNLTTIGEVLIRIEMGTKDNIVSKYKVYITDKKLRTKNTLHTVSHWGSSIDVHWSELTKYVVKVEQLSFFDPRNPNDCNTYTLDEFNKCVGNEMKKLWKPLINCYPPWLTSEDQCDRRMNITTSKGDKIFNETFATGVGVYQMTTFPAKERCFNPCTVAQSMVLLNGKNKVNDNSSYLSMNFEK